MEFAVLATARLGRASQLDGGYGWAVVAASFMISLLADGVTFSFGLLLTELFSSMGGSREQLAWISSLLSGVPLLMGPITSVLIDRFGCGPVSIVGGLLACLGFVLVFACPPSRLLVILSGGLLSGIGLGLCYMPAVTAVSYYFVRRRALATGISVSGSGVGTLIFAYITGASLKAFGWRGTFLLLGCLLLNISLCGALFLRLKPEFTVIQPKNKRQNATSAHNTGGSHRDGGGCPDGTAGRLFLNRRHLLPSRSNMCYEDLLHSKNNTTDPPINLESRIDEDIGSMNSDRNGTWFKKLVCLLHHPAYLLFLASNCLLYFWYNITYYFLPEHALELGLNSGQVELIIGAIGVSSAIGQIFLGLAADQSKIDTTLLYSLCIGLAGLANCLVPLCTSFASLLVYSLTFGLMVSANFSLCSILLIEHFGLDRFIAAFGVTLFAQGLSSLFGPPTIGYMRDADTNYNRAFVFSGAFILVSALLTVPCYFLPFVRSTFTYCCCCWCRSCCDSCECCEQVGENNRNSASARASPKSMAVTGKSGDSLDSADR